VGLRRRSTGQTTPRAALARLVHEVALGARGVVALDDRRPLASTAGEGGERVRGVWCVAEPSGRYELHVYITVRPVSIPALAERIRRRVRTAALEQGLAEKVGQIEIVVVDVVTEVGDRP
jgi:uncharacterized alkaline shock family protein YloU